MRDEVASPFRTGEERASQTKAPGLSRRSLMIAAGAAAVLPPAAASAQSCAGPADKEGYFLVFSDRGPKSGNDGYKDGEVVDDRIFFIPSEWLNQFEVTEYYNRLSQQPGFGDWKSDTVAADLRKESHRGRGGRTLRRAKVQALYSDGEFENAELRRPTADGTTCFAYQEPAKDTVYVAAMVGPAS